MKISVIGTGYVGLVTGTCLAETGNEVICVDIDKEKVEKMRNGVVPIYEPHLDVLFDRNIKADRLQFTTSLDEGLEHGKIIFLALPTPEDEDGSADLSYVLNVSKLIGEKIKEYKVIVDKSTVPVGTAEKVKQVISKKAICEFDVISNPEFLREGFAVDDFLKPERIVIGSSSDKATSLMQKLYKPFVRSGNPIIVMDEKSAELTKYAANAFLATKITFMNEIANYCEKVGADVDKIRAGMGTDSRIGKRFLFPGIGYGGSCFPKDTRALIDTANQFKTDLTIVKSVISSNNKRKLLLTKRLEKILDANPSPLAFYIFSKNQKFIDKLINSNKFGGCVVNDTLIHFVNSNLPFGGIGPSGMGAYRGKFSFDTFTHYKPVLEKKSMIDLPLRYGPYPSSFNFIKKILEKI